MTRNEFVKGCISISIISLVLLLLFYFLSSVTFSLSTVSLLIALVVFITLMRIASIRLQTAYSKFKKRLSKHYFALLVSIEKLASFCFMLFAGSLTYQSYVKDEHQTLGALVAILVVYGVNTYRTERASYNDR